MPLFHGVGGVYIICYWKSIGEKKCDDKAFIFTLKNAHGVEPTRYMKKKENNYALYCHSDCGPTFGDDIHIYDKCNKENCCRIDNHEYSTYEYHPQYEFSLFVNTAGPKNKNRFFILEYEVFAHV